MQKSSGPAVYNLAVLSKEKRIFEGQAITLTAPGEMGYLQILARHAPIIALLKAGPLTFVDSENQQHSYKITSGLLEVSQGACSVIVSLEK